MGDGAGNARLCCSNDHRRGKGSVAAVNDSGEGSGVGRAGDGSAGSLACAHPGTALHLRRSAATGSVCRHPRCALDQLSNRRPSRGAMMSTMQSSAEFVSLLQRGSTGVPESRHQHRPTFSGAEIEARREQQRFAQRLGRGRLERRYKPGAASRPAGYGEGIEGFRQAVGSGDGAKIFLADPGDLPAGFGIAPGPALLCAQ